MNAETPTIISAEKNKQQKHNIFEFWKITITE